MNTLRDHDAVIAAWLDDGPQTLPHDTRQAIVVGIRTVARRRAGVSWPFTRPGLPTIDLLPLSVALGSAAVIVVAATLAVNFYLHRAGIGGLPTTPGAWERVIIETPSGIGSVVSLAASPHGLLAVVGEDWRSDVARLVVSTDGQNWALVPAARHPKLSAPNGFGGPWGYPSVIGTDGGFLLLQLNELQLTEIWTSEDGYDWRRPAGAATGTDFGPRAVTAGGPGLVGVGGDNAWYSVDGSDWSEAVVPALPEEILPRPASERYVEMTGVTAAGNDLIAWGMASVPFANNSEERVEVPLLWASHDGRTWASVVDPRMDSLAAVMDGPDGLVAVGETDGLATVWLSADGQIWEKVDVRGLPPPISIGQGAATKAGYVLVGGDRDCFGGSCRPSTAAAIWTSPDGRSWSRLPSDERFARAGATHVIAFGSRFVVGGGHDGGPTIWISDPDRSGSASQ